MAAPGDLSLAAHFTADRQIAVPIIQPGSGLSATGGAVARRDDFSAIKQYVAAGCFDGLRNQAIGPGQ